MDDSDLDVLIDRALAEDLSAGDVTTETLIPSELQGRAVVMAKAEGVLAGVDVALAVFRRVDAGLNARALLKDGSAVQPRSLIAEIEGAVSSILKAERTAINFLQRLSGIATATDTYVKAVEGYAARILDTRKTTPGLRSLEKYAVRVGGGQNHRTSLGDGVLIKDNHIKALRDIGMSLGEIVERALAGATGGVRVEVEVEDLDDVREALDAGAEMLLLDNMAVPDMAEAVKLAQGRAVTEASGGIYLGNVHAVAATGVDLISVGSLTHSVTSLDTSLELV